MNLEWKPQSKKTAFTTKVFEIQEITSLSPDATTGTFYSLNAPDWVIIIPVLENPDGTDSFLMVHQWRHGTEEMSIEFPGGVMDSGESPAKSAQRELVEETGYQSKSLIHLASISPNPAIMNNHCHIFCAKDLINTKELHLDNDEYLTVSTIPATEVCASMGKGLYNHGLMAAALFLYLQKKGYPK